MTAQKKTPQIGGSRGVSGSSCKQIVAQPRERREELKVASFDAIADAIAGQMAAAQFVRDLRGNIVAPDLLFARLRGITDDAAMRGFCRVIQKTLEQGNELTALQLGPR